MSKSKGNAKEYRINVLDRAVLILRAFSVAEPELTLSEVSARTGIHVSTCLRLLSNLRTHGFVTRDERHGTYRLGYELLALAEIVRMGGGLVNWAMPVMSDLRETFDETVVLSIRSGNERIDVEQVVGRQPVRRVIELGVPKPLYAGAASRVLLAGLGDEEFEEYLATVTLRKLAEATITDRETLRREVLKARVEGVAESVQEQSDRGGAGVAAPIYNARREVVGALGISVPQFRFTSSLRAQLVPAVRGGANRISQLLSSSRGQGAVSPQ